MTPTKKRSSPVKLIIILAAILVFFILFGTLITDMILINAEKPPFFSSVFSVKHNDGEVTVGRGLLYKTVCHRIDVSNGYLAGYGIYFPWEEDYSRLEEIFPSLDLKFHGSEDITPETVEGTSGEEDGEIIEIGDDTLNMDAVKELSYGGIDPFEFMEKFPAETNPAENNPEHTSYMLMLPNDYALNIIYNGDEIIDMFLFDKQLNQYIDIRSQSIDMFLLEREAE